MLKVRLQKNCTVCAGHEGGAESVIHAMFSILQEENVEAVLLINASNACNPLNRQVEFNNIRILCPRASVNLHLYSP